MNEIVSGEERIHALLASMTLEEKAALTAGSSIWYGNRVARLGIPRLKVTDGPIGARGGNLGGGKSSACFPSASALAATWNPELVQEVGVALGEEAHTKQCHVLLGPTVNMHRSPLGGRHFECYSEDPHLTARIAVGFVRGVQSQKVGVSVKHFVANDSEFERHTINSEVSERALREIYLVPFEAAVKEASAWTIMGAYNGVNGTPACSHRGLLHDVLKEEWGFDGLVVSDWFALKDTVGPGAGGLDLEMPGPPRFFGHALAEAVEAGSVAAEELDDKALRILRVMERTGALDAGELEAPEEAVDREDHRALARRAAGEALVLLKNDHEALPLANTVRRVAVIGPNAELTSEQGGGSARVLPHYRTHVLEELRNALGEDTEVSFSRGCTSHKTLPILDARSFDPDNAEASGFEAKFFQGFAFEGEPVLERTIRKLDLIWLGEVGKGVDPSSFSLRLTGDFVAAEDGAHVFGLTCAGKARLFVDGELLVDNWNDQTRGDAFFGTGTREESATKALTAGQKANLVIEYCSDGAVAMPGLKVGHHPPIPADLMDQAVRAAHEADQAIVVVGLNSDWETEGHDKDDMILPGAQVELIERVAEAQPNTVVVVNAGAPVLMDWADDVAAVLWAWYGGQEAGRAIVDALTGRINPSGRLPTTFPMRSEDVPCHTGNPKAYPGEDGRVVYEEDLWVGHRHYEAEGITPRFPFGYGLSYSLCEVEGAELSALRGDLRVPLSVKVFLRNLSDVAGQEVVQVYVHDVESRLPRPDQELKGFGKVEVPAGGSVELSIPLPRRAFSYWDPAASAFVAEPGTFEIRVGTASNQLPFRLPFELTEG